MENLINFVLNLRTWDIAGYFLVILVIPALLLGFFISISEKLSIKIDNMIDFIYQTKIIKQIRIIHIICTIYLVLFIFYLVLIFCSKEMDKNIQVQIEKKYSEYKDYFYFYNVPPLTYKFNAYPYQNNNYNKHTSLGFKLCDLNDYQGKFCASYLSYFAENKLAEAKEIKVVKKENDEFYQKEMAQRKKDLEIKKAKEQFREKNIEAIIK